jgi:hypothetical protein
VSFDPPLREDGEILISLLIHLCESTGDARRVGYYIAMDGRVVGIFTIMLKSA